MNFHILNADTINLSDQIINDIYNEYHDCIIRKQGNICILWINLDLKADLPGEVLLLPKGSIPQKYCPNIFTPLPAVARDGGQWMSANYVPVDVTVNSDGSIQLFTGTGANKAIYLSVNLAYFAKN